MIEMLKKVLPSSDQRTLKRYSKLVEEINAKESYFTSLTDEELRAKTSEYKDLLKDTSINNIRVDAFATVREAAKRVLGMRHYDVQLIGGLALLEGNIAEMATGEGKTLVASLPSYVRALEGKGVHVITVNEYLAKRDFEMIGQIHRFLGLEVGLNVSMMQPHEKLQAYQADITYGVGTEFGFDFLRDHMVKGESEQVQRPHYYAIIDEVDSVLVDEAKTPLIIAGKMSLNPGLSNICASVIKQFKDDVDYLHDPETKTVHFTDDGISKIEAIFSVDNLYDLEHQTLFHYMNQALKAMVLFHRDVDYIVKEGKVGLVDMFTGRIMEGRSLSDGLHQAIEAKEGLELTDENKQQASVTVQNYFRKYELLSGMTGTAKTEEKEFNQVYGMQVVQIPPNKPRKRVDQTDVVYDTIEEKYLAVAKEVASRHALGQPVLVGTTSILQSEEVARFLRKEGITFELLNAKSVENEVRLISLAGQKGQVTIATNMAGRGTDIMLGEGVSDLGGLHVIGTERHESRRIDNQLKGRSGRQGDPGSTQFFLSLDDDIMKRFGLDDREKLRKSMKKDANGKVESKNVLDIFDRVQRICEGSNYSIREYTLKLDDVVDEQRKVMYSIRDRLLYEDQVMEVIKQLTRDIGGHYLDTLGEIEDWEDVPVEQILTKVNRVLLSPITDEEVVTVSSIKEFEGMIQTKFDEMTTRLVELSQSNGDWLQAVRIQMISIFDRQWVTHLERMNRLKEGIGLRSYGQEDPIRMYQKEGLEIFTDTFLNFKQEALMLTHIALQSFEEAKSE
ncbi:accessory Sec system translocase SecA2 [Mangrovibacillus cuniculi]|uniref:Protein translocase subunit SecA n=1 Tax=Mangrovibacillus cuniculi TaxID=2593652 RepID=A0A7S8CCS5_9BACI|nr:accessory Sec system translocase SecA2 [Mangrovibacillus cuniculi]QPC47532.1 accessory Sec system translocase SecA2 [Mangrovibacillus cuniculi]